VLSFFLVGWEWWANEWTGDCNVAQQSAAVQDFQGAAVASTNIGPDPDFPDFDLICDA
jgi:hypothetical protein